MDLSLIGCAAAAARSSPRFSHGEGRVGGKRGSCSRGSCSTQRRRKDRQRRKRPPAFPPSPAPLFILLLSFIPLFPSLLYPPPPSLSRRRREARVAGARSFVRSGAAHAEKGRGKDGTREVGGEGERGSWSCIGSVCPSLPSSVLTGRLSMSVSHLIKHVVVARLSRLAESRPYNSVRGDDGGTKGPA